nr:MAG TPA: hypothetical protein [Caudoviricetes sp.]
MAIGQHCGSKPDFADVRVLRRATTPQRELSQIGCKIDLVI